MGKATSVAHRERVVRLKKEGHSFEAIGEQLSLSRPNVRDIWTRYRQQGEVGLSTAYANWGPKGLETPPLLRRAQPLRPGHTRHPGNLPGRSSMDRI